MFCLKRSCSEEHYVLWILNGTAHKQKITSIFLSDQIEAIRTWRKTSVISSLEIWRLCVVDFYFFYFFCAGVVCCLHQPFQLACQERQDINLEQELYIEMCNWYWDVRSRRRIIMSNLRQIKQQNKTKESVFCLHQELDIDKEPCNPGLSHGACSHIVQHYWVETYDKKVPRDLLVSRNGQNQPICPSSSITMVSKQEYVYLMLSPVFYIVKNEYFQLFWSNFFLHF